MVAQAVDVRPELSVVESTGRGKGKLRFTLHAGQTRAWDSEKRFVLILAGLQSGKTSFYPPWLWREMKRKGPGDYLVASPTFTLLELKALPEFKRFFVTNMRAGDYKASPIREFTLNRRGELMLWGEPQEVPTRVLFGHAQDPDSLESGTYKAAVLDEAGQKKFRRDSWVSIQGRLSIHQGRVLFPTTPYTLGWLKSEIYDPWVKSGQNHPDIDVINFESVENPVFPQAEFDRMRAQLPRWLFNMRYRGRFERPAGMIYDCFNEATHVLPRFPIPPEWPRFGGADFGGVHTAAIFLAQEHAEGKETGRYIAYREYLAGGLTTKQHADALLKDEPRIPKFIGGAHSEDQYRRDFGAAGLPISQPLVREVESGILRVYAGITENELVIFDDLTGLLEEVRTYSRVLDANGEPTEEIEDKSTFHRLDALRYIATLLWSGLSSNPVLN